MQHVNSPMNTTSPHLPLPTNTTTNSNGISSTSPTFRWSDLNHSGETLVICRLSTYRILSSTEFRGGILQTLLYPFDHATDTEYNPVRSAGDRTPIWQRV